MTDSELLSAYHARKAALAAYRKLPNRPIARLTLAQRHLADKLAAEHERCDAAIVAELRRRTAPVTRGRLKFHLCFHRADGFAVLDAVTGHTVPERGPKYEAWVRESLFDYSRPIPELPARRGATP